MHLHGYLSAVPRTRTHSASSQFVRYETTTPLSAHTPTYLPTLHTTGYVVPYLPLLPKVCHDVINVGLILRSAVLRPRRSVVCRIVAFMPRVTLYLHPPHCHPPARGGDGTCAICFEESATSLCPSASPFCGRTRACFAMTIAAGFKLYLAANFPSAPAHAT